MHSISCLGWAKSNQRRQCLPTDGHGTKAKASSGDKAVSACPFLLNLLSPDGSAAQCHCRASPAGRCMSGARLTGCEAIIALYWAEAGPCRPWNLLRSTEALGCIGAMQCFFRDEAPNICFVQDAPGTLHADMPAALLVRGYGMEGAYFILMVGAGAAITSTTHAHFAWW